MPARGEASSSSRRHRRAAARCDRGRAARVAAAGEATTRGLGRTFVVFRRLLGDRVFVGYTLSGALAFAAMFAYVARSPFVIQDIYGVSPGLFSLVFALNALGLVAAGRLSAHLVGR
jgi:DHA1 family bicyclomycin/chloramphenicol resistance-like MFS transporter